MPYQIKEWSDLFETGKTRTVITKTYGTFPLKNGIGFHRLMARPDGLEVYGIFILMVSYCHGHAPDVRNGWLTLDGTAEGKPASTEDFALKFGGTAKKWENAFSVLSDPELQIEWLLREGEAGSPATADKPPKKPQPTDEQVEAIYQVYPRKCAKQDALKAIRKAIIRDGLGIVSKQTARFALEVDKWAKDEMQFCPYPATFYNQSRYMDDPKTWVRTHKEIDLAKQEGFGTVPERNKMLDGWAKRYVKAGDNWAEILQKATDKYGESFATAMVERAKRMEEQ